MLSNRGTSAGGLNGGKESPKQFANSRIRTGFSMSNQARIFPDDREGRSLFDAASFWGTSKAGAASSANLTAEGRQNSRNNLDIKDRSGTMSRHNSGEGEGPMPFDVEVPVSYGTVKAENVTSSQIGITDLSSPGAIATTSGLGGVVEDSIPISVDPTQATSLVEKIETERVPCPRLCGAVFGKGNGGLVTFHNGEVRKMWSWFQRMDPLRESQFAAGKADLVTADQRNLRIVHNASTSGAAGPIVSPEEAIGNIEVVAKTGPRTLKELVHMMAAAKEVRCMVFTISHILTCKYSHSPFCLLPNRLNGEKIIFRMVSLTLTMGSVMATIFSNTKVLRPIALKMMRLVMTLPLVETRCTSDILVARLGRAQLKRGNKLHHHRPHGRLFLYLEPSLET